MDIKDKLEAQIKKSGSISSSDVASMAANASTETPEEQLVKDAMIEVSDKIKNDPLLTAADKGAPQNSISDDVAASVDALNKHKYLVTGYDTSNMDSDKLVLTGEDKSAFISSLISNERFTLGCTLFDGKVVLEFRSRTQQEGFAILEHLNQELRDGKLESDLAYSIRLRNALLAAQVSRLNNDHFSELAAPLFRAVKGDQITDPAWLSQIDFWSKQSEGLVNAVYKQLRIFEYKYLTMVDNADNQNFWKTAQSI